MQITFPNLGFLWRDSQKWNYWGKEYTFFSDSWYFSVALMEGFKSQEWLLSVKPNDFVPILFLLCGICVCWPPLCLKPPSPKLSVKWHSFPSPTFSQATSSLPPLTFSICACPRPTLALTFLTGYWLGCPHFCLPNFGCPVLSWALIPSRFCLLLSLVLALPWDHLCPQCWENKHILVHLHMHSVLRDSGCRWSFIWAKFSLFVLYENDMVPCWKNII